MLLGLKDHKYVRSDLKTEFMSLKTFNIENVGDTTHAYHLYQIAHTWEITNEARAVRLS